MRIKLAADCFKMIFEVCDESAIYFWLILKKLFEKNDYKLNYENLNLNLTSRKIFAYKGSTYSRMNKYIDLLISMEGKKTYRIIQRLEVLVVLARFGILVVNAWM